MATWDPRVNTLFLDAVGLDAAAERAAFLERACGSDDALRAQVDSLLQANDRAGSFLERPAHALADTRGFDQARGVAREAAGATFGPYRLLEQLGEGGMGSVWLAEQTEPVRRQVALKIIKPGLDSREVIARFEAERQALALMDHPNIARVFDGGATPDGRPFFVMELVKGVPITAYCDEFRLTARQRLELFVSVCQAIQHAHHKGIIHRDVKPSNVLVTLYDGAAVVKVIDFGVAKATGRQLTEETLQTGFGAVVGTLEYMSPEQASFNLLDVDTRSDVYSLGVLLYELLAGSPPFSRKDLEQGGVLEMLRMIREQEPPRPSTKLSTADGLPALAANRGTEPKRLTALVRGELDWIVMKALEKDRSRRYETANGFALDVQRYLADEPVLACPPSAGYRLKKFVRRNRGPVWAAAVVLLTLLGGIVGTTVGLVQAEEARRAEADRTEGERRAKELAQANLALAIDAVEKYLGTVTNDPELKRADFSRLRKKLLESAIPFFQKLAAQKSDDPEVEAGRGRAYSRLIRVRAALGENELALQDAAAMQAIFARLTTDFPAEPKYRLGLADGHRSLAIAQKRLGKLVESEATSRLALDTMEKLVAGFPTTPEYAVGLAGDLKNLANTLAKLMKHEEAEAAYRRSLRIREKLAAAFPRVPEYRQKVANTNNDLSLLLTDQGEYEKSKAAIDQALDIQAKLVAAFTEEPEYRTNLAKYHGNLGRLLLYLGNRKAAVAAYRKALDIAEKLAREFPSVPQYRSQLAFSHDSLGWALERLGDFPKADAAYREALDIREKLARDFSTTPEYRQDLAGSHLRLGNRMYALGKWPEAEARFRQAISILESLVKECPAEPYYRYDLAGIRGKLGLALNRRRKRSEAAAEFGLAIDALKKLTAEYPDIWQFALELGANLCNLGIHLKVEGRSTEALDWYQRAVQTLTPLVKRNPRLPHARQFLRNSHINRALLLTELKRFAEAMPDWDRGIEFDDDKDRPLRRMERASCLAHVEPEKAVAEAEDVVKDDKVPSIVILYAARVCALCSTTVKDADKREQYAARAVALLQQARARGNFRNKSNFEGLKNDTGLDPLRHREDFKKLLKDLQEK